MKDTGMARGDAKETQRRALGTAATWLPVAEGMDTDAEREGEALMGEAGEAEVSAGEDVARQDSIIQSAAVR